MASIVVWMLVFANSGIGGLGPELVCVGSIVWLALVKFHPAVGFSLRVDIGLGSVDGGWGCCLKVLVFVLKL